MGTLATGKLKRAGGGVLLLCIGTAIVGALILPDSGDGATALPTPDALKDTPTPKPIPGQPKDQPNSNLTFGLPTKDGQRGLPSDDGQRPRR